jgi:hypothetical protein
MKYPMSQPMIGLFLQIILVGCTTVVTAFSPPSAVARSVWQIPIVQHNYRSSNPKTRLLLSSTVSNDNDMSTIVYQPIFNFANSSEGAVSKFDRIDDAVGISCLLFPKCCLLSFARMSCSRVSPSHLSL